MLSVIYGVLCNKHQLSHMSACPFRARSRLERGPCQGNESNRQPWFWASGPPLLRMRPTASSCQNVGSRPRRLSLLDCAIYFSVCTARAKRLAEAVGARSRRFIRLVAWPRLLVRTARTSLRPRSAENAAPRRIATRRDSAREHGSAERGCRCCRSSSFNPTAAICSKKNRSGPRQVSSPDYNPRTHARYAMRLPGLHRC